jgi:hypothetical protein
MKQLLFEDGKIDRSLTVIKNLVLPDILTRAYVYTKYNSGNKKVKNNSNTHFDFLNKYLELKIKGEYTKKLEKSIKYINTQKTYLKEQRTLGNFILDNTINLDFKVSKLITKFLKDIFNRSELETFLSDFIHLNKEDKYSSTIVLKSFSNFFTYDVNIINTNNTCCMLKKIFRKKLSLIDLLLIDFGAWKVEISIKNNITGHTLWVGEISINFTKLISKLNKFFKKEIKTLMKENKQSDITVLYETLILKFLKSKFDVNKDIKVEIKDIKSLDKIVFLEAIFYYFTNGRGILTKSSEFDRIIKIYDIDGNSIFYITENNLSSDNIITNIYITHISQNNKNICILTINGLNKLIFENITVDGCKKLKDLVEYILKQF